MKRMQHIVRAAYMQPHLKTMIPLIISLLIAALPLLAQTEQPVTAPEPVVSPMHPTFALLDESGQNVLQSGGAVSTLKTCGQCHDTAFIAENNDHGISEHWNGIDDIQRQDISSEMNCFLCHAAAPDNTARQTALQSGEFEWANTATLSGTGIVEKIDGVWTWNPAAFDANGELLEQYVSIQDPDSENCGQCHGEVHMNAQLPLQLTTPDASQWMTYTSGQVFSPQKLANSGMNLADKTNLSRSFDIHAERVVKCTDCHYAANNPVYYDEGETQPQHLQFDPRRLDFGEYLNRPLHQFATAENGRDCASCHDAASTHNWLPYVERHTAVLACETCHIPKLYAPALQSVDWTAGEPVRAYRGAEGELITGYEPVLLPREDRDGVTRLAPYNLVTSWYWVSGDDAQPVSQEELRAALPGNTDTLTEEEAAAVVSKLAGLGLKNPRIIAETRAYAINHNVAAGEWAIRECRACHGSDSLIDRNLLLSDQTPGGVQPTFINQTNLHGTIEQDSTGQLYFQPESSAANLYVLGNDSVSWVDWLGALMFFGVFAVAIIHGGLRYLASRRNIPQQHELRKVYMYSVYERQWHWLQTALIFGLLFTGMVIHKPEMFGMFSFAYIVQVHNVLAVILLINAALAAFYHLASGEIRQFLPQPHGFFNDAIVQAKYYLYGIFRGEEHPIAKTRQRKMNPLQQITYLAILNVLLPLQVITGILMWGAQQWPDITAQLGGLAFLAPFHSLVAWSFAAFIVAHVYLTTTGHTAFANIRSMIMGWDEVEVQHTAPAGEGD